MMRLFTLPFLVIEILDGHWRFAFVLLWISGLSDALDGLVARKFGQQTTLGQYLDPIADKALLSTMFLVLTHVGMIPRYVTVLVFSRDLGILLISTLLFVTNILRDFRPSLLGKWSTAVQILAVLTVMTVQLAPVWALVEMKTSCCGWWRCWRRLRRRSMRGSRCARCRRRTGDRRVPLLRGRRVSGVAGWLPRRGTRAGCAEGRLRLN